MMMRHSAGRWLLLAGLTALCGCHEETVQFTEVIRIEERLRPSDFAKFRRILQDLPEKKFPLRCEILDPPGEWNASRSLPVHELLVEERRLIQQRWDVERLSQPLAQNRNLQRLLRRESLTPQQFVGIALSVLVAHARAQAPSTPELQRLAQLSREQLGPIDKDPRLFAKLRPDQQHDAWLGAVALHRLDRCERMLSIPLDNVELVRAHREFLEAQLPAEYQGNPLANLTDMVDSRGIPFEELPGSGSDDKIEWNPEEAVENPLPLTGRIREATKLR